jgi:hypothetical protein
MLQAVKTLPDVRTAGASRCDVSPSIGVALALRVCSCPQNIRHCACGCVPEGTYDVFPSSRCPAEQVFLSADTSWSTSPTWISDLDPSRCTDLDPSR